MKSPKLLSLVFLLLRIAETHSLAFKVSNSLPPDTESCFLEEHKITTRVNINFACVGLCQGHSSCLLACSIGGRCRLYSANVSPSWAGMTGSNPELSGATCFSLWAERKDAMPTTTISTTVNVHPDTPAGLEGAKDGFACRKNEHKYIFCTISTANPWFKVDLGTSKWVDRVVVQVRGYPSYPTHFQNIEVRVGDTDGNGDFSANELLMYSEGKAPLGAIITFKREKALGGRYVSVKFLAFDALCVPEMKVILA